MPFGVAKEERTMFDELMGRINDEVHGYEHNHKTAAYSGVVAGLALSARLLENGWRGMINPVTREEWFYLRDISIDMCPQDFIVDLRMISDGRIALGMEDFPHPELFTNRPFNETYEQALIDMVNWVFSAGHDYISTEGRQSLREACARASAMITVIMP